MVVGRKRVSYGEVAFRIVLAGLQTEEGHHGHDDEARDR